MGAWPWGTIRKFISGVRPLLKPWVWLGPVAD